MDPFCVRWDRRSARRPIVLWWRFHVRIRCETQHGLLSAASALPSEEPSSKLGREKATDIAKGTATLRVSMTPMASVLPGFRSAGKRMRV